MPLPLEPIPLAFPAGGVNRNFALAAQPEGTAVDATNVRLFEQVGGRARGGQRPGTEKLFAESTAGEPVDELIVHVSPLGALSDIQIEEEFLTTFQDDHGPGEADGSGTAYGDGDQLNETGNAGPWEVYQNIGDAAPTEIFDTDHFRIQDEASVLFMRKESTGATPTSLALKNPGVDYNLTDNYDIFIRCDGINSSGGDPTFGFADGDDLNWPIRQYGAPIIRAESDWTGVLYCIMNGSWYTAPGTPAAAVPNLLVYSVIDGALTLEHNVAPLAELTGGVADVFPVGAFPAEWVECYIQVRGTTLSFHFRLSTQGSFIKTHEVTSSILLGQQGLGFFDGTNGGLDAVYSRYEVGVARPGVFGRRRNVVVAFGNSDVYEGDLTTDTPALAEITTGVAGLTPGNIQAVSLFGNVYAVDGTRAIIIRNLEDQETASEKFEYASEVTAGTLPDNIQGITAYRGCIVLYGDRDDANNWYMSRVADPLDFDFAGTPLEVAAFAADNSDLGRNPDPVFAMAPWHDDLMVIGGSQSLRQVTGDPRLGGAIDVITDQLGILGFKAWTLGPGGLLYFMGTDGFYMLPLGSKSPQNLSRDKLNDVLGNVDTSSLYVIVRYDPLAQGVHIFLSPRTMGSTGMHVFYDARSDSFWPQEFANTDHEPFSAVSLYGNIDTDQGVIMGCVDGFLRIFRDAQKDDDGTAIVSSLEFPPIVAFESLLEAKMRELQITTAGSSDSLVVTIDAADSEDELARDVLTGSVVNTFTGGGFQSPRRMSLRYAAARLRLTNSVLSSSWGMERANVMVQTAGRRR